MIHFQGLTTYRNHKELKVTKILAEKALQSLICINIVGTEGLREQWSADLFTWLVMLERTPHFAEPDPGWEKTNMLHTVLRRPHCLWTLTTLTLGGYSLRQNLGSSAKHPPVPQMEVSLWKKSNLCSIVKCPIPRVSFI